MTIYTLHLLYSSFGSTLNSFSYSELFYPLIIFRRGLLLLHLVTLAGTHTHTHIHTYTLGRTPLDERSARRRDHYLATHNTQKRQTSVPLVGFKPAIQESERKQTRPLIRMATGIGFDMQLLSVNGVMNRFFAHLTRVKREKAF